MDWIWEGSSVAETVRPGSPSCAFFCLTLNWRFLFQILFRSIGVKLSFWLATKQIFWNEVSIYDGIWKPIHSRKSVFETGALRGFFWCIYIQKWCTKPPDSPIWLGSGSKISIFSMVAGSVQQIDDGKASADAPRKFLTRLYCNLRLVKSLFTDFFSHLSTNPHLWGAPSPPKRSSTYLWAPSNSNSNSILTLTPSFIDLSSSFEIY